ncbi:ABC transporter substrate-binding protein [Pararhodospirillum photometricum]|uniref:Extracellular solute-binding protein, family 5 n=1 Tax=Pararhodospirillum photometricum DSM 122 TaxID=1150469 RepID=H6SMT7_PARPM|nr:ABC transporter substrate-binding protein [Pararhodospirillum photometricum]CCG09222.1 Extracellular solute-binding protein, family 5 [Pararhodospirillum photometricum DSM 122]
MKQRARIRTTLLIGLALANTPAWAAPPASRPLVACLAEGPRILNPALSPAPATRDTVGRTVYEGLTRFRPGTTTVEPGLAEGWTVSEDGKTYTFVLRPTVSFHSTARFTPTRPLEAQDVVWTLARQGKDDHPFHRVSGATYETYTALGLGDLIERIEALDARTVRLTLTRPWAPLPAALAMEFAGIHSAEYAQARLKAGAPEDVDRFPVGTGPYVLREATDDTLRFDAHLGYWEGKPGLETLVIKIVPDDSQRAQKLRAGECHMIDAVAPADLEPLRTTPGVALPQGPGLALSVLAFNTEKPPFDSLAVRRILAQALDPVALVAGPFNGRGVPLTRALPPAQWPLPEAPPPTLATSDTLKAELAALPAIGPITLWALPVRRASLPDPKAAALWVKAAWEALGLSVTVETLDWGDYLKRARAGDAQALFLTWSTDTGDPDDFLSLLGCEAVGGFNVARWCHKPFDDLLRRGRQSVDPEERVWIYRDALALVRDQVPWVPLAAPLLMQAHRTSVTGWTVSPFGGPSFRAVGMTP